MQVRENRTCTFVKRKLIWKSKIYSLGDRSQIISKTYFMYYNSIGKKNNIVDYDTKGKSGENKNMNKDIIFECYLVTIYLYLSINAQNKIENFLFLRRTDTLNIIHNK